MTPQDFLESVVEGEPRPRLKRKRCGCVCMGTEESWRCSPCKKKQICHRLTAKEVEGMTSRLPRLHKNSEHFFRNLGNQGIISYRLPLTQPPPPPPKKSKSKKPFFFQPCFFLQRVPLPADHPDQAAVWVQDRLCHAGPGRKWVDRQGRV